MTVAAPKHSAETLPTLDVIIPCYHAVDTLERAVVSVLKQSSVQRLILVNDGSTDGTGALMDKLADGHPDKISTLHLPMNGGVAMARNQGALISTADIVAFLDADDAYEPHALDIVPSIFMMMPHLALLRLKLTGVDLPERYAKHPDIARAWEVLQMTVGGNMIMPRGLLLGVGGFPTDALFRRLGGEDAALGIALCEAAAVGTLFDAPHAGVLHYCRDGMHAERLLDAHLFNLMDDKITEAARSEAAAVTARIKANLARLAPIMTPIISGENVGRRPLIVSYQ